LPAGRVAATPPVTGLRLSLRPRRGRRPGLEPVPGRADQAVHRDGHGCAPPDPPGGGAAGPGALLLSPVTPSRRDGNLDYFFSPFPVIAFATELTTRPTAFGISATAFTSPAMGDSPRSMLQRIPPFSFGIRTGVRNPDRRSAGRVRHGRCLIPFTKLDRN